MTDRTDIPWLLARVTELSHELSIYQGMANMHETTLKRTEAENTDLKSAIKELHDQDAAAHACSYDRIREIDRLAADLKEACEIIHDLWCMVNSQHPVSTRAIAFTARVRNGGGG